MRQGSVVVNLMTGMGEFCPDLLHLLGPNGKVNAVDNRSLDWNGVSPGFFPKWQPTVAIP